MSGQWTDRLGKLLPPQRIPIKGRTASGPIVRSTGVGQVVVPLDVPPPPGGVYRRPTPPGGAAQKWTGPQRSIADVRHPLGDLESKYKDDDFAVGDQVTAPAANVIICALRPALNWHTAFNIDIWAQIGSGSPAAADIGNITVYIGSIGGGATQQATGTFAGQTLSTFTGFYNKIRLPINSTGGLGPFGFRRTLTERDYIIVASGPNTATSGVIYMAAIVARPAPRVIVHQ